MAKNKYSHLSKQDLQELIKEVKKIGPKQMLPDLLVEEKKRQGNFITRMFL